MSYLIGIVAIIIIIFAVAILAAWLSKHMHRVGQNRGYAEGYEAGYTRAKYDQRMEIITRHYEQEHNRD